MYAATAILAALRVREKTGVGQLIDVPLYDSQVAWLANQSMNYLVSGQVPERLGTAHPNLVPYQAFRTSDGSVMLAVGNDRQFRACMTCIGCSDLGEDPRYASNSARVENRASLVALIEERLVCERTSHWLELFAKEGVPAGPINDLAEVLTNQHARERGIVRTLDNAAGDAVPIVSNPVAFSQTPVSYEKAPPLLGEHTDEVLQEWLGYSAELISELRKDSAI